MTEMDIVFMIYDVGDRDVGLEVSNTADVDGMLRLRTPNQASASWYASSFDISISLDMAKELKFALGKLIEMME